MKNIILKLITVIFIGILTSCVDLDLNPREQMTSAQFKEDPASLEYSTIGAYRWFFANRDNPEMPGGSSGRDRYNRNWFQMNELRSDNVLVSGTSTDPFMKSYDYKDNSADATCRYIWYCSYSILNILNANIGAANEGVSLKDDHILGENYFLRALVYLNLCDLYARPYTHGANNPAVILRTEEIQPELGKATRATIGEIYEQVEKDLKKAIELMGQNYRRSEDASFAWKGSAQGLLSRLYLYMERNQEVVNIVDEMIAGRSLADVLDPDLATYFTRTKTSRETLWCIGMLANESMGGNSVASMYFAAPTGVGWGQHFPSDPMYALLTRYADDDIRWKDFHQYQAVSPPQSHLGKPVEWLACWPVPILAADYYMYQFRFLTEDAGGKYIIFNDQLDSPTEDTYFSNTSTKIYIETEIVNTYPKYFFTYNGNRVDVTVTPATSNRNSFRKIFNTKFSYQDGDPMLCSMPMIRWGEIVLNRAEAYAKLNDTAAALDDVNAIRTRAGLKGDQLMTIDNMEPRGYNNILDIVLDERRLELVYEGFRWKDLYRNKRDMDRRYGGAHPYEIVQWTDPRIPHQISEDEMFINSGVLPNPK